MTSWKVPTPPRHPTPSLPFSSQMRTQNMKWTKKNVSAGWGAVRCVRFFFFIRWILYWGIFFRFVFFLVCLLTVCAAVRCRANNMMNVEKHLTFSSSSYSSPSRFSLWTVILFCDIRSCVVEMCIFPATSYLVCLAFSILFRHSWLNVANNEWS